MRFGSRALSLLILPASVLTAMLFACTSETPDSPGSGSTPPASTTPATSSTGSTDAATSGDAESPTTFTPPPQCTSFVYSDWSPCHYNGSQTRTVTTGIPDHCYGGGPVLRQSCEFTVPTDAAGLYEAYCADCHLNAKKGKTASAITNAINGNTGGMSVLADKLSPAQIDLIASVK